MFKHSKITENLEEDLAGVEDPGVRCNFEGPSEFTMCTEMLLAAPVSRRSSQLRDFKNTGTRAF